jgi:hypothetical protein
MELTREEHFWRSALKGYLHWYRFFGDNVCDFAAGLCHPTFLGHLAGRHTNKIFPGASAIKLFWIVIYTFSQWARVFVRDKLFQHSLTIILA